MRVIAGSAGRIKLNAPKGLDTRPTTDRIKETLFNIINTDVYNVKFLDLFAGSGAIGIEALSRGAKFAVFVDNDKRAINCIKDNLKVTKLEKVGRVVFSPVKKAISFLEQDKLVFDIVFIDPPYNKDYEKDILMLLRNSLIINSDTIIIVESSIETKFNYLEEIGFELYKYKEYGSCKHSFIKLRK